MPIKKDYIAIQIEKWAAMANDCPGRVNVYGIDPGMMCKVVGDWCNHDNCIFKHWGVI